MVLVNSCLELSALYCMDICVYFNTIYFWARSKFISDEDKIWVLLLLLSFVHNFLREIKRVFSGKKFQVSNQLNAVRFCRKAWPQPHSGMFTVWVQTLFSKNKQKDIKEVWPLIPLTSCQFQAWINELGRASGVKTCQSSMRISFLVFNQLHS